MQIGLGFGQTRKLCNGLSDFRWLRGLATHEFGDSSGHDGVLLSM
jgi:hypothetical protein